MKVEDDGQEKPTGNALAVGRARGRVFQGCENEREGGQRCVGGSRGIPMIWCKRAHLDASFDFFLQIPALRSLPPSSLHVVHRVSSGSGLHPCALTPRNARQN